MERKYPRAQWHNYNGGIYFVTVCTHNWQHRFGEIVDSSITYTELGSYLCKAIEELPLHYPGITVECYVVMPNHFHAIISILTDKLQPSVTATTKTGCLHSPLHPLENDNFEERNHYNSLLSRAVGGVKAAVTKQAHRKNIEFRWQPNFYDHIIRDGKEFYMIEQYINTNVESWFKDRFHS